MNYSFTNKVQVYSYRVVSIIKEEEKPVVIVASYNEVCLKLNKPKWLLKTSKEGDSTSILVAWSYPGLNIYNFQIVNKPFIENIIKVVKGLKEGNLWMLGPNKFIESLADFNLVQTQIEQFIEYFYKNKSACEIMKIKIELEKHNNKNS